MEGSVFGEEDNQTIWHTGGTRLRRNSESAPVHNTTSVSIGGVSTSTYVLGDGHGTNHVLLRAPPAINLNPITQDDSVGYIQNLALSRLVQYEQMRILLGGKVMEVDKRNPVRPVQAHGTKPMHVGKFDDARSELPDRSPPGTPGERGGNPMTWKEDILSTFGVDSQANRSRSHSHSSSDTSSSESTDISSADNSLAGSPTSVHRRKVRPNTGTADSSQP